jgi:hypothetical protein
MEEPVQPEAQEHEPDKHACRDDSSGSHLVCLSD